VTFTRRTPLRRSSGLTTRTALARTQRTPSAPPERDWRDASTLTPAEAETMAVLPGTVAVVAQLLDLSREAAGQRLNTLRHLGLVAKPERRGGVWSAVEAGGPEA